MFERVARVAKRFLATGHLSSSPVSMIHRSLDGRAVFFVQIGFHDGLMGNPLHAVIKKNPFWRGIFIEPLEEPFRRLMDNYGHDGRFIFGQLAISNQVKERVFPLRAIW
jgi:hypothetical protein